RRLEIRAVRRGRLLPAGRSVLLVVPHDDDEVRGPGPADRRQRSEIHEERSIAVEDEDAQIGPYHRQAEPDGRGEPHAAPRVEVRVAGAGGKEVGGGRPEARGDGHGTGGRRRVPDAAGGLEAIQARAPAGEGAGTVTRRGNRHAPAVRVPKAVCATR